MKSRIAVGVTVAAAFGLPAAAPAHVERTSYWPDPRPDTSVRPAAGGEVPKTRPLRTALRKRARGDTRVVCQSGSLSLAEASIRAARRHGYRYRPLGGRHKLGKKKARRLLRIERRLFKACRYHDIQPAVTDSRNNDRVVIMPGIYTEPASRAVPGLPKECDKYRTTSENGSGAVSYTFQFHCPNAVNLVALIGRDVGPGQDPPVTPTGRPDPHGIPNLGPCIRCNVQIEGSGVTADDVVIDAGRVASGNGAPIEPRKDVGIRVDRADGAVVRNLTVRHAAEHGIYVHETDGYLLDNFKAFYDGEYGTLTFASDHGMTSDCESVGHGDSAVYPGGAPDTGAVRDESFYPERRLNQAITRCDLHHNTLGYSGTMGNATHVYGNNFYDNTTGIATDSFYAGGHPGFPQDSAVFEDNRIWSNNFNSHVEGSDVDSAVPVPVGTGILIGGGNDDIVRHNRIWDNWRRGTMLIAVPDVVSCAPSPDQGSPACAPESPASTSNRNHYVNNVMGQAPDGKPMPNGVDFWWDEFPGNQGNCWYPNTGSAGTTASITSDPPPPPVEGTSVPKFLPEDCDAPTNVGAGDAVKQAMLAACLGAVGTDNWDPNMCEWFQTPAKPGTPEAAAQQQRNRQTAEGLAGVVNFDRFCTLLGGGRGGTLTCSPFKGRI